MNTAEVRHQARLRYVVSCAACGFDADVETVGDAVAVIDEHEALNLGPCRHAQTPWCVECRAEPF